MNGKNEQEHGHRRHEGHDEAHPAFTRIHASRVEAQRQGTVSGMQGKG
jgi:hypothetical protein